MIANFDGLFDGNNTVLLAIRRNEGHIVRANLAAAEFYGYSPEEFQTMNLADLCAERANQPWNHIRALFERKNEFHSIHRCADGTDHDVHIISTPMKFDGKAVFLLTIFDVTAWKKAEKALAKSEAHYRSIVDTPMAQVSRWLPDTTLTFVNNAYAVFCGKSAEELVGTKWIDAIPEESRDFFLMEAEKKVSEMMPGVFEHPVRTANGVVWMMWMDSPVFDENGQLLEYQSIGMDITDRKEDKLQLMEYARRILRQQEGFLRLSPLPSSSISTMEEAYSDICADALNLPASSIQKNHNKLATRYRQLERAWDQMIEVLGKIIEARDPYTAGHQRRVSRLAEAIAREMGLERRRIYEIRQSALVHDIGKIEIPGEILSKPGALSSLEMDFVRFHSTAGWRLLKNLDLPWPLAEIVKQHHERMDGKGYPDGLKGNDILLEARVIAVADTMEAMSSHRPYRPALGVGAALDEIWNGAGTKYDPMVVDACIQIFKRGNFSFEETNVEEVSGCKQ